ncbi:ATP-binding protein [Candidatus Micrarchaeota archaeon]|nr:ATP-binding protein [Candidatus Micrarchaeota archaeon]
MNSLGTIITTEQSPSTTEFTFVVNGAKVLKGQYVQVPMQDGGMIFGFVNEITKANRYFERPESVAEFEKGSGIKSNFPVDSWEYELALVKILGKFAANKFARVFHPPSPGMKIYEAENSILKSFLGFDEKGLDIGTIEHHDVPAKLSLTRLVQKHLAILAMSGAGKSHLASVLLEELLSRKKEDGRIAVVAIDIHGEYLGFAHDPSLGRQCTLVDCAELRFPLKKLSTETIAQWVPDLSAPQREVLRQVLGLLKAKKDQGFSFKELIEAVDASDVSKDEVKRALKRTLNELKNYRFLSRKTENPKLGTLRPGNMLILDFSAIDSLRKKQILVSLIAKRLFMLRKKNKIPPFLLLIEEAHNFAREKAEERDAVSRSIIETIAREGRKFGAAICLISQRPVNLSTTALSQCNTHIILRVTNPNDLDHIQMSSEGIDSRVAKSITSLKVGEALIVGEAVNYPVFVSVRERRSQKRERGLPLHQQAIDFEEKAKKKEKGAEAFI